MNKEEKRQLKILKMASLEATDKDLELVETVQELEDSTDERFNILESKIDNIGEELKKKLESELVLEIDKEELKGNKGEDGQDGKDYILTPKDKAEIASYIKVPVVEKVIEKTEIIREQPIVTNNTEVIELAVTDEPPVIADKLNTLTEAIEPEVIKGYKDLKRIVNENANKLYTGVSETRVNELIAKIPVPNTSTPSLQQVTDVGAITTNDISVPDEVYGAGWNGSMEVPTKNALYDKIESLPTGTIDGTLTANELVYGVDSNTIGSLPVATYPSLTELSYVKGVTSAIQTQLNGKQASGTYVTGATDSTLTLTSTTLGLNLGNANTWTATQTFGDGTQKESFTSYPTTANRNDANFSVGIKFVAVNDMVVTRLGRLYVSGNSQNHAARLYLSSNTASPIASGTILNASTSDANNFKWVDITPVTLIAGETYTVALDENASGDVWKNEWTPSLQSDFTTVYSMFGTIGAYPSNQYVLNTMFSTPALDYHYPQTTISSNGVSTQDNISGRKVTVSNIGESFVSTVPYTSAVATPRMNFYVKDGNTGYPANNTKWFTWSADVNSQKTEIMKLYAIDATSWQLGGSFGISPLNLSSASGFGNGITILYSYLNFNQAGNPWRDAVNTDTSKPFWFSSQTSNGATKIGFRFDQATAFTTAGAKLATFENASVVKAYIDKDGGVVSGGTVTTAGYTVATLPTGVIGMRAYVTDATAPTYLGALTGGGAVVCPVFYNGTAWVSA